MTSLDRDLELDASPARRRRPKVVRQRDAEDCGAAALATVCSYFGPVPGLRQLRSLTSVGIDGTSMHCLAQAARHLGLNCSGVQISFAGMRKVRLPAITTIGYHFVVVDSVDRDTVLVADPAVGWRRISRDEFCLDWPGALLLFEPTPDFPSKVRTNQSLTTRAWQLAAPVFRPLIAVLLFTLLMNVAGLSLPVLTQIMVDRHFSGGEKGLPGILVLTAAMALILCAALEGVRHLVVTRVSARLQLLVGERFLHHLLSLPLPYFLTRRTGDSVNRAEEIQRLSSFLGSQGAEAIVDVLLAILSLGLVFYYSTSLGALLLSLGLSLLIAALVLGPLIYSRLEAASHMQVEAISLFIESVRKVALLKSCQAESRWTDRWREQTMAANKALLSAENLSGALAVGTQLVFRATPLLAVFIGLRDSSALSIGALVSVSSIISVSLSSLLRLSNHHLEAQKVLLSLDRILDVFDEAPEETNAANSSAPQQQRGGPPRIELLGVGFRYSDASPQVLSGVDLAIEPGSTVALVGRSGSGKSTLAHLLCGLLRPVEGAILLDGLDLNRIPLTDLRQRVALVAQECPLIQGTILENITLSKAGDRTRAARASRMAQAEEFILADPLGYDRMLDEDGTGLSAGQRQRIAIARALYREPDVLILDEPTSALDSESERALMRALRSLHGSLTLVLIAHRLQTLRQVERIFVIESGHVAESGSPEELLAQDGRYQALSRAAEAHRAQEWVQ